MKKVLLLFALLVGVITASADSYTITFNTSSSDATNDITSSAFLDYITEGAANVLSITNINKAYKGKNGIKLSSSSKNGSFTINLSDAGQVEATSIVINAAGCGSDNSSISINGVNKSISGTSLADYTYDLNGSKITTINVSATKRSYIKSITVNYKDAVQATHVAINPAEGGTFENSKEVILTALDAEENAVEGTKVFYTIGDEAQQEGTSPVTFTLTKSATVKAWVGTEEPASATFTITVPEVKPDAPVFKVGEEVLTDEDVTLPYNSQLTVSAVNATSLEIGVNDEISTVESNTATIDIKEDAIITVTAKNGNESTEGMIMITLADQTLTVMAAGKVVENGQNVTLVKGIAIEVITIGAKEVLISDPNGEKITLDNNNKFVPQLEGEYNIEAALTGHTSAKITFSVVLEEPQTEEIVATYDFTIGGAYGLTPFKTNSYEKEANNLKEKDVTISFTGDYRQWESKGPVYDLRIYAGASMTVKVPLNCYITNISIEFGDKIALSYNGTTYESTPANILIDASNIIKEAELKANSQNRINKITVTYTKEKITASGVVALGDAVEYSYGHANVMTFKPTIYVGGQPIEENDYSNFKVSFMDKEIGVAEMNAPLSQFPYNKDGKFTLSYNGENIVVSEVSGWPNIESDPVLHNNEGKIDVEYVKKDDNKVDVIYYVVPENAPQNMYWTVKSDEPNASVYWREGHTGAACHFNNLGTWNESGITVNHVAEFEARIAYPFAVLPVFASAQRVAPLAETNNITISEYESTPTKKVSTANVPDPVEGGNVSGVADVAVDQDAEVEFFNLQGVRVEGELTPGLYIRRQGNRATKVVVK